MGYPQIFKQMWVTSLNQEDKVKGGNGLKFIFPQNYDFKSKILGFIDYSTAIIDLIWGILIFGILNILHIKLKFKIFMFVVLVFPVVLFSIVGFNGEGIIKVCSYLLKYLSKPKVILYKK